MRRVLVIAALGLALAPVAAAQYDAAKPVGSEMVWEATIRGVSG